MRAADCGIQDGAPSRAPRTHCAMASQSGSFCEANWRPPEWKASPPASGASGVSKGGCEVGRDGIQMAHGFEAWLRKASAPVDKQAGGSAWRGSFTAVRELKNKFDGELDLAFRDGGPYQRARSPARIAWRRRQGCSGAIKNIGIDVPRCWGLEIRFIANINHFTAELAHEVLSTL